MIYFGIIKQKIFKNNNELAYFLKKNKLYKEAKEKTIYFSHDFQDSLIIEQDLKNHSLNEIGEKNTTLKSVQIFSLTLFEFMKVVSIQLKNQFKNDLNQLSIIEVREKKDLNNLLIDENIKLEPTNLLLDDLYDSIICHFDHIIQNERTTFYNQFNEQIFGLDFDKQKRIALKHYKKLYNFLFKDNETYMPDDYSDFFDFEIEILKIENKLQMVYCNKLKYQYKLACINPFFEYLNGETSIFLKKYYSKKWSTIEEVLTYEATKSIMIELNNRFKFEEDFYFTNSLDDKKKFEKYDDLFTSFNAFMFTNVEIKKYLENVKANIESLYEFLRVNNLINKGKNKFISYLKNEHNIHLTKIIAYINYDNREDFPEGGKKPNDEHEKRVKIITEKWSNFT